MEGWANLGQTGCPETYSQDSCCDQSLRPADVQTTTTTRGWRPPPPTPPPPPQLQTDRGSCHPAERSDGLQVGATACSALSKQLLGTSHRLHELRIWQQQTPKAKVPRNHQAPPWKHGRESILPRTLRGGNDSLLITHQETEVSNRLPLGQSHTVYKNQDSTSAFSG